MTPGDNVSYSSQGYTPRARRLLSVASIVAAASAAMFDFGGMGFGPGVGHLSGTYQPGKRGNARNPSYTKKGPGRRHREGDGRRTGAERTVLTDAQRYDRGYMHASAARRYERATGLQLFHRYERAVERLRGVSL